MSAFGQSHDDDDLWALTAFVRRLQFITPEQYQTMTEHTPMNEEPGHERLSHTREPAQPHKH
jgi:hypothetical protein